MTFLSYGTLKHQSATDENEMAETSYSGTENLHTLLLKFFGVFFVSKGKRISMFL